MPESASGEPMIANWPALRELALGLALPGVEDALSWGHPCLKAHGKLWTWWSPQENAGVFKVPREEREVLCEVDPDTFYVTPHYQPHGLILARPGKIDPAWARANLTRVWRQQAPKRVLKAFDAGLPL